MKTTILALVLILVLTHVQAADGAKNPAKSAPVVRNIVSTRLPVRLQTSIKKNYKDYWITDLYEELINGKTTYYITLENADQKIKLNTTHTSSWAIARIVSKDWASR